MLMVYPNYFATMGMPFARGRDFGPGDLGERSPLACIVNEAFAQERFGGENPLGQHITIDGLPTFRGAAIIGVVKNVTSYSLRERPAPAVHLPFI